MIKIDLKLRCLSDWWYYSAKHRVGFCESGILGFFDVPKGTKRVTLKVSKRKSKHSYKIILTGDENFYEVELIDSSGVEQSPTTCSQDDLAFKLLKPGKTYYLSLEY